jgi:hypothetical protein
MIVFMIQQLPWDATTPRGSRRSCTSHCFQQGG